MIKHKFKFTILILIIFSIVLIHNNIFDVKDRIYKKYPNIQIELRNEIIKLAGKETLPENLDNDYNVKFLPKTQFLKLDLKKKKLTFSDYYYEKHPYDWMQNSFYIETINGKIIITNYLGEIYYGKIEDLKNKQLNNLPLEIINSNLSSHRVLDTYIYNDKLYVSYIGKKINGCKKLNIAVAEINFKKLSFENFFKSKECGEYLQGGRMFFYNHKNIDGLLFSTSDQLPDIIDNKPQKVESIFGKILFIELISKKYSIFSIGHRNIQGLYVSNDVILATEHGPRGGDEINKIIFNKNYGWPIASYGEKYSIQNPKQLSYSNSHSSYGYQEPIYSYVPSIAPSEIIKLSNNFSKIFQNNFLLSTLGERHLHRLKFDDSYTRVLFDEKIYIGERVRDIKFIDELSAVILAFEEKGEIGVLTIKEK